MQLKDHSSGWADERCDILLWLTMNSEWQARQARSGRDMDLFSPHVAPLQLLHQAPPPVFPPVSFYPFLGDGPYGVRVVCPIAPSHHHPKSLPDSLKGHGGGHRPPILLFSISSLESLRFCICD